MKLRFLFFLLLWFFASVNAEAQPPSAGPVPATAPAEAFRDHFNCDGNPGFSCINVLWSRHFGTVRQFQNSPQIAVDAQGQVYLSGVFKESLNLGGATLRAPAANGAFLAKFSPEGKPLWSRVVASSDIVNPLLLLALDSTNSVYLSGSFAGELKIGAGKLGGAGAADFFLAKFDAEGNPLWSRRFGDEQMQVVRGLAVDSGGSVYLTGGFQGTLDFGESSLKSAGASDIFLTKFDPKGKNLWSRRFGDADSSQYGANVVADSSGHVYLAGPLDGTIQLGDEILQGPPSAETSAFLAKFDPTGKPLWSQILGNADGKHMRLTLDTQGNAYLGLRIRESYRRETGGPPPTAAEDRQSLIVVKFEPNGRQAWLERIDNKDLHIAFDSMSVPNPDQIHISGTCVGDSHPSKSINFFWLPRMSLCLVHLIRSGGHFRLVSTRDFGNPNFLGDFHVLSDARQNLYLYGNFGDRLDLGNLKMNATGSADIFLVKFKY